MLLLLDGGADTLCCVVSLLVDTADTTVDRYRDTQTGKVSVAQVEYCDVLLDWQRTQTANVVTAYVLDTVLSSWVQTCRLPRLAG